MGSNRTQELVNNDMSNRTKNCFFIYLIIVGSLIARPALNTEIFRVEDAAGNVIYTDKSSSHNDAQQVKLPSRAFRHLHQVKHVYDGDTIILKNGQRVRLLGINTPEIESRHRTGEPGGIAAKTWLQQQLKGKKVYLEYDLEKRDKYKRLLAHVFLTHGKHLNLELLKNGLAFINIIPPNLRHAEMFSRAQQQAESQKLGIWKLPAYQVRPLDQIASGARGWQRYLGTPQNIQQKRSYTYLTINDHVDIRIANEHLRHFPALETYLEKTVEIRGWVSRRGGKYSISIHHPSALIVR